LFFLSDKEYAVPKDNPFRGNNEALPEIWAYGFRNPYRFSFDKETGAMWLGDVGGAVRGLT
jgi:glucose/arabinose dehydrogenase